MAELSSSARLFISRTSNGRKERASPSMKWSGSHTLPHHIADLVPKPFVRFSSVCRLGRHKVNDCTDTETGNIGVNSHCDSEDMGLKAV